jgi:hypothetical protein
VLRCNVETKNVDFQNVEKTFLATSWIHDSPPQGFDTHLKC